MLQTREVKAALIIIVKDLVHVDFVPLKVIGSYNH